MATATYGYSFIFLEQDADASVSALAALMSTISLRVGRDFWGMSGRFDYSAGPTIGDVTGRIETLNWRNSNSGTSPLIPFLSIEDVRVSYQEFVVNSGFDVSVFFEGDDLISGSDGNDLLSGRLSGGTGNDMILLNSGDDLAEGGAGNDTLNGGAGDDILVGGDGVDTAVFSGAQSNYTLTLSPLSTTLSDRRFAGDDTDTLQGIELLDFATQLPIFGQGSMNIDLFDDLTSLDSAVFSQIVELYIAYFNRAPDAIGLYFWASAFARGEVDLEQMAELFFEQAETRATYADALSSDGGTIIDIPTFVTAVYSNVLGRAFDDAGREFWVGVLEQGSVSTGGFINAIIAGAKAPAEPNASLDFLEQKAQDIAYLSGKADIGTYFSAIRGMSDVDDAQAIMALFDGSEDSITAARLEADAVFASASGPSDGAFLMPLVGVLPDPFA